MIKTTTNTRTMNARPFSITTVLRNAVALARQRRKLSRLDNTALRDMGITRTEARTESRRPVWDAPCNWRH